MIRTWHRRVQQEWPRACRIFDLCDLVKQMLLGLHALASLLLHVCVLADGRSQHHYAVEVFGLVRCPHFLAQPNDTRWGRAACSAPCPELAVMRAHACVRLHCCSHCAECRMRLGLLLHHVDIIEESEYGCAWKLLRCLGKTVVLT